MTIGSTCRSWARWLSFPLVLCFVTAAVEAPYAQAAEPEVDVEALIKRGNELRTKGKDFEAYHYFRRAYDTRSTPRTAGQLGLVEFALERWVDAELHLQEALASSNDPWVKENNDIFLSSLATVRTHLGDLDIRGGPPGALVTVGSLPAVELPLPRPLRVAAGHVAVYVTVGSKVLTASKAFVRAGSSTILQLPDAPGDAPAHEPILQLAPPGKMAGPQDRATVTTEPSPPRAAAPGEGLRLAGWLVGTLGLAAVGTGIYASFRVKELESDYANPTNADRRPALETQGTNMERLQYASYALGAVALGLGAFLYYKGYQRKERRVAIDVEVTQGFGLALLLEGRAW